MKINLIAAVGENGLIGRGNDLPWRIPADLSHFKTTTLGHVILMGSNTWRSFGSRSLPNRHHVIVSSRPEQITVFENDRPRVTIVSDLQTAIMCSTVRAEKQDQDQFFVIGGGAIYDQTIGLANRLIITHVKGDFGTRPNDVCFPKIDETWAIAEERPSTTDNGFEFQIKVYERR